MDVDMMIDTSAYYGSRILVLLIAAVVGFIIFEMQKRKIERLTTANVHSSIVLLHKRHAGDPNYASMTEITRIDGEFWSLEYRIKEKKFIFTKCNPNKMYKYA